MENKQPKDRPGRHFHFHDKVTYIERQEITVQSGATFYNGPGREYSEVTKEESLALLSDDQLRQMINAVLPSIKNNRHWFPVLKVLMLRGQLMDGDFKGGHDRLLRIYPAGIAHDFDPEDISRLHIGCMRLPIDRWKLEDSCFKRHAEFMHYKKLAEDFDREFTLIR